MANIEQTTTQVVKTATGAARRGLTLVKTRARRKDTVGEATYRALELVSGGLGTASKALRDLGEATRPPARGDHDRTAPSGELEAPQSKTAGRRPGARPKTA
jgi:hypothetical protein